jgi:hypothetical protein
LGAAAAPAPPGGSDSLSGPSQTGAIEVRPVASAADRTSFLDIPYRLYASDPNWIEPLRLERRQHIDPRRNPWFEHADAAFFLALRGGRPVGRISAQIDRLARERDPRSPAQFGMLEAERGDRDIVAALLAAAEQFAHQCGSTYLRGPFSLSINDECGLLVEGFDSAPAMMMGHAPPEYASALERLGYAKAKDLLAYELPLQGELPEVIRRALARSELPGRVTARPLRMSRFQEEIRTLVEIFNDAWSANWGFVPFTEAEVRHLASSLKPLIRPDLISFAELDGRPVGVFAAVPDLNEAIRGLGGRLLPFNWARLLWRLKMDKVRRFRVPLAGVRRVYQRGFAGGEIMYRMYAQVWHALRARGFVAGEVGWILEDNMPMRRIIEAAGGWPRKTYRIYEKALA